MGIFRNRFGNKDSQENNGEELSADKRSTPAETGMALTAEKREELLSLCLHTPSSFYSEMQKGEQLLVLDERCACSFCIHKELASPASKSERASGTAFAVDECHVYGRQEAAGWYSVHIMQAERHPSGFCSEAVAVLAKRSNQSGNAEPLLYAPDGVVTDGYEGLSLCDLGMDDGYVKEKGLDEAGLYLHTFRMGGVRYCAYLLCACKDKNAWLLAYVERCDGEVALPPLATERAGAFFSSFSSAQQTFSKEEKDCDKYSSRKSDCFLQDEAVFRFLQDREETRKTDFHRLLSVLRDARIWAPVIPSGGNPTGVGEGGRRIIDETSACRLLGLRSSDGGRIPLFHVALEEIPKEIKCVLETDFYHLMERCARYGTLDSVLLFCRGRRLEIPLSVLEGYYRALGIAYGENHGNRELQKAIRACVKKRTEETLDAVVDGLLSSHVYVRAAKEGVRSERRSPLLTETFFDATNAIPILPQLRDGEGNALVGLYTEPIAAEENGVPLVARIQPHFGLLLFPRTAGVIIDPHSLNLRITRRELEDCLQRKGIAAGGTRPIPEGAVFSEQEILRAVEQYLALPNRERVSNFAFKKYYGRRKAAVVISHGPWNKGKYSFSFAVSGESEPEIPLCEQTVFVCDTPEQIAEEIKIHPMQSEQSDIFRQLTELLEQERGRGEGILPDAFYGGLAANRECLETGYRFPFRLGGRELFLSVHPVEKIGKRVLHVGVFLDEAKRMRKEIILSGDLGEDFGALMEKIRQRDSLVLEVRRLLETLL